MLVDDAKEVIALLTLRGYAVNVTPVSPAKDGRGYDFDNDSKLYGKRSELDDLIAGQRKSVKLYKSEPLPVKTVDVKKR